MFKLTALITTLVLGSTASITMAHTFDTRPAVTPARIESRARVAVDYRDRAERYPGAPRGASDDFGARHYRASWIALSAPLQLSRGEQDRIEIRDRGTFTQLRVQSARGHARIDRVVVQFADGSRQVAQLDRVLDSRGEFVEIPLDGNNRRVARIFVTGSTGRRGDLQVFGI